MPAPAYAYRTLADVEESPTPIVWHEAPTIAADVSGLDEDLAALLLVELEAAVTVWNAVDCAPELAILGGSDTASAQVVVRVVSEWSGSGFEPTAAGTADLVLASTMDGGAQITAATLSLNGTFEWGPHPQDGGDVRDLRAVLVHELGHVLGLAHSQDARAAMAEAYAGSSQARLADDDVGGVCSLYAVPSPPPPGCQVDSECAPGHWCIEGGCHPELRYGTECTDGSECFGARCVELAAGGGACTYVCESDEDCPAATGCLPVEGRPTERVCAPAAGGGCAIAARPAPSPLVPLLFAALAALLRARRRARGRGKLAALLACLLASGCGAPPEGGPDAGSDGGPSDAGGASDAGGGIDADITPPDATVEPDAGPAPECEPMEMRIATCGFCGMQAQTCDETRQWTATSECLGEGECAFGSVETRDLEMCAQEQRLCLEGCVWSDWEMSRGPGVCAPGATRTSGDACPPGETRDEACNDACEWTGTSVCSNPCGLTPRTTPDWASEVCVPAGNFMRGSLTYTRTQPIAEIYVSSFLIDAYPVTIRRYRQCVDAGACTPSSHPAYALPERLDYPVQDVTRSQAIQFCAWDGGRRLPTEAEWEKAARGPSPRMNPYPWDGATWDCSLVVNPDCPGYVWPSSSEENWARDPYDAVPGTRSYYGTYLQISGVREIVLDFYHRDWYSNPRSLLPDPLATEADSYAPPLGPATEVRGFLRRGRGELAGRGGWAPGGDPDETTGFRCARSAP